MDTKADATGSIEVTGHLGDVMKESTRLAHTFARTHLRLVDPDNLFLQKVGVFSGVYIFYL